MESAHAQALGDPHARLPRYPSAPPSLFSLWTSKPAYRTQQHRLLWRAPHILGGSFMSANSANDSTETYAHHYCPQMFPNKSDFRGILV